jgi:hypothetical protein
MDNGLIFPYPLARANAESSDANHPNRAWFLLREGRGLGSVGPELVVGE